MSLRSGGLSSGYYSFERPGSLPAVVRRTCSSTISGAQDSAYRTRGLVDEQLSDGPVVRYPGGVGGDQRIDGPCAAVTFQSVARDKLIAIRAQLVDQPAAEQHAKFQAQVSVAGHSWGGRRRCGGYLHGDHLSTHDPVLHAGPVGRHPPWPG